MLVEAVMSTDLVTCAAEDTLRTAAEQMLREGVGSVIVVNDGDPAGILTETDLMQSGYATDEPFSAIPVTNAMSTPLVTIAEDDTLRKATDRMESECIKKLPVERDLELVGMVTLTDIAYHLSDIKNEIHEIERRSFEEQKNW